jgi:hypothetical protein
VFHVPIHRLLRRAAPLLPALLLLGACAQVPRESVELSATVGRDLAEVHRAHRELAIRYFARMKADIDRFVDEQYRPFVIRDTLERLQLLDELKQEKNPAVLFQKMEIYVVEASKRIEDTRRQWLAPVTEQEAEVLKSLDRSYLTIQNANAIVTGHLASVVSSGSPTGWWRCRTGSRTSSTRRAKARRGSTRPRPSSTG